MTGEKNKFFLIYHNFCVSVGRQGCSLQPTALSSRKRKIKQLFVFCWLQAVSVDGVIFQTRRHHRSGDASLWPGLIDVPLPVLHSGVPLLDSRPCHPKPGPYVTRHRELRPPTGTLVYKTPACQFFLGLNNE